MIMTDDSWYVVRNTPGVTGFVGSSGQGTKPTPLLPHEVDELLKKIGMDKKVVKVDFELKENVKVTAGPFADRDRKSTRLNSSHVAISYAVFCLKKKRG